MSGAMHTGSTNSVQRLFAAKAREWQSSKDADLEVHNLFKPGALRPEGPVVPLVCKVVDLIIATSRDSNSSKCLK